MMLEFGSMMAFSYLFYGLMPVLPLVYLVLRWRQGRSGEPSDPQLGLKAVLYYFHAIGLQLCLAAIALALFALMERHTEEMLRMSAGLLIGGGGIMGLQLTLLNGTNTKEFTRARRALTGFNMIISGLLMASGWLAAAMTLVMESSPSEPLKVGLVLAVVYGVAFWRFSTSLR